MSATFLADAIAADKEGLIRRWRDRVRGTIDPAAAAPEEIIDSLPAFLDELVSLLRMEKPEETTDKTRAIAAHHGSVRFHAGFSLGAVIREYGVLRDCVLELARDRRIEVDIDELKALLGLLNAGVVIGAEQFARERDQAIERQSREHFGFIAHELRNPLGSALLAAQVLQRRAGPRDEVALDRLLRNLSMVRQLIDTSLSSVRARDLGDGHNLETTEVSLGEVVDCARTEIVGDAEEKHLTLIVDGEARIQADQRLVRSAVTNLMRNAVKYTRDGGRIDVRIRTGEQVASIEVEDECGGLPDGKSEELFTPFVQRGADRSGFGLGLAIAKDAVQAHQGNVQVSNLPGKGCVFMLTFPLGRPAAGR
ncbi:MAG TPA: HAMP domain-containing sensor histidine kinase [Polyangia bacterium]